MTIGIPFRYLYVKFILEGGEKVKRGSHRVLPGMRRVVWKNRTRRPVFCEFIAVIDESVDLGGVTMKKGGRRRSPFFNSSRSGYAQPRSFIASTTRSTATT